MKGKKNAPLVRAAHTKTQVGTKANQDRCNLVYTRFPLRDRRTTHHVRPGFRAHARARGRSSECVQA